MASNQATGQEAGAVYVSVMPSGRGFSKAMDKDLDGAFTGAASRGTNTFGRMFARAAAAGAAILATLGLGKLVKETIALGVEYNTLEQTSRAAFTTLLGSADAAAAMMKDLREFAKTSPFPRQGYIKAAQQMTAFGIESKKVIPYLDAITDAVAASGGSGQQLEEIAFVMAQISSAGKITGQDLIQFGQRGVNAAELIGSQMGKTGAEIREAITKGTLGADDALDALAAGMAEKFDGAAANVKNTWLGSVDRIKGAWRDISSMLIAPFIDPEGGGYAVKWANLVADSLRGLESSGALSAFQDKLRDIAKSMDSTFGDIARAIPLLAMDNGLGRFVDALGGMFPVIGFINDVAKMLGPVLPVLATALVDVAKALLAEGVIDALVELITEVLPPLAELLVAIAPLIPPLAQMLTAVLVPATKETAGHLAATVDVMRLLFDFVAGGFNVDKFISDAHAIWATLGPIGDFAKDVWDNLLGMSKALIGFFASLGQSMATALGSQVNMMKAHLNNLIDAVNKAIRGLNSIASDVGNALGIGFALQIPTIPRLATSGTVLPKPGGTLILAAEAGRAESVVDTGKLNGLMDAAANGGGGDRPVYADGIGLIAVLREVAGQQAELIFNTKLQRSYAVGR